ncbi:hypothetical protein VTL71DRAFT_6772 [Oculimacula yallundae]|uniref:Alpha/beta hydrolase fold-3 domain-containing protein n=1 Tax=Oculimacula yallundae TaxID=86028 RepID=A0ABR4BZG0_9HELO
MSTRTTHTFKTASSLPISLDIYTPSSRSQASKPYLPTNPVILFLHGGGLVSHSRRLLHPHIVQSSLLRNWPLISADYRLFPQATAEEMFGDVHDAYRFVREKVLGILNGGGEGVLENIILVGQSAGGYLAYISSLSLRPPPTALLIYYSAPTFHSSLLRSASLPTASTLTLPQISHFLTPTITTGFTPPEMEFDTSSLLPDLSRNPDWSKKVYEGEVLRDILFFWLMKEDWYTKALEGVDKGWEDERWRDFHVPVVLVHGDKDEMVPLELAERAVDVIGPVKPKLFVVPGVGHAWDHGFLGDTSLKETEEAWEALSEIVEAEFRK